MTNKQVLLKKNYDENKIYMYMEWDMAGFISFMVLYTFLYVSCAGEITKDKVKKSNGLQARKTFMEYR